MREIAADDELLVHATQHRPLPRRQYISKMILLNTESKTLALTPTPAFCEERDDTEFYNDSHGYIIRRDNKIKLAISYGAISDDNMDRVIGTKVRVKNYTNGRDMGKYAVIGIVRYCDGAHRGEVPRGKLALWVFK